MFPVVNESEIWVPLMAVGKLVSMLGWQLHEASHLNKKRKAMTFQEKLMKVGVVCVRCQLPVLTHSSFKSWGYEVNPTRNLVPHGAAETV